MQPIEIIGGGLAGLSLGVALRRAGIPVTLFEAGDFPRHRVCGEFIAGLDPATFDTLELHPFLAGAERPGVVAWVTPDGRAHTNTLPAAAYGLSRYELDARLARAFAAAGGELRTATRVPDPRPRAGRVLATGRRKSRAQWLGLKVHALQLELAADLEVHLGNHAYVGLSRIENHRVNICGLFRQSRLSPPTRSRMATAAETQLGDAAHARVFFAYLDLAGLTPLAARLRAAPLDATSFAAVSALGFDRGVPRRDGIFIGDACAMIPPFTGNGMAMAFQSAAIALAPLVQYARDEIDWASACAATHRGLAARFRTRLFTANALHPFLLRPRRQRGLAALGRAGLLPFRPLFAALH